MKYTKFLSAVMMISAVFCSCENEDNEKSKQLSQIQLYL